jgi:hypothetical protein
LTARGEQIEQTLDRRCDLRINVVSPAAIARAATAENLEWL